MQNEKLAPLFIDNQPVNLQDPNPKVSAILSACGLPGATGLKWVQFQPAGQGRTMRPDETVDRTSEPTKPIYLTSAVDGKFAGPTVLRGKSSPAGGQSTASGASRPSGQAPGQPAQASGTQKPASGSGGQPQSSQKGGAAQGRSGAGDKAGHGAGAEGRRGGQRPVSGGRQASSEDEGDSGSEDEGEDEDDK